MSKKADQRAARRARALRLVRQPLPIEPCPRVFPAVREPFYLYELGLRADPFMTTPRRGELPPIIHR